MQFREQLAECLELNVGSEEGPRILWDSVKGFIRSHTLFASNLHKVRLSKVEKLEDLYANLNASLQSNYNDQLDLQVKVVKK